MAKRKNEPEFFPSKPIEVKGLQFGEWAICPKCRARVRETVCRTCDGTGIVPNKGPIPFVKEVGGSASKKRTQPP